MKRLSCVVQGYAWGKLGNESSVAVLKAGADPAFLVDPQQPYAEYWMGTHPNGPSTLGDGTLLGDWLKQNPQALGESLQDLPFLFKVLSVRTALSIQAHPDLALAKQLHASSPHIYKDANHKPEMAIAITRFEALCQFRAVGEIVAHFQDVPELQSLLNDANVLSELAQRQDGQSLRNLFQSFMDASGDILASQLASLSVRLRAKAASDRSDIENLVLRLYDQYNVDIGVLCPYLLNYITLEPGQAMFLGANEPHAYISGDCVECMACSDNVVRAGLTPKFIDKSTLCAMLTYNTGSPQILGRDKIDDTLRVYPSPVPEFEVEALHLPSSSTYSLPRRKGASVFIVLEGKGIAAESTGASGGHEELSKGVVMFASAHEQVHITTEEEPIIIYRAFPNEHL